MNSQVFVGNLTRDPELRVGASGKPRVRFSIAINEGSAERANEKTHFVNFTAWNTLAENIANSLRKGQRVIVSARIDTYSKAVTIDGVEKSVTITDFIASAAGPELTFASAAVTKNTRKDDRDEDEGPAPAAVSDAPAPKTPAVKTTRQRATVPAAAAPEEDDDF